MKNDEDENGKFPLHTPLKIIRDFAELFEGGFEVFDPSTRSTAWPWALAQGRPERSESRDDDFLDDDVGIWRLSGLFELSYRRQKMSM